MNIEINMEEKILDYLKLRKETCSSEIFLGLVEMAAFLLMVSVDDIFNKISD